MLDQGWSLNLDGNGPAWSWFDAGRYAKSDAMAAAAARKSPAAAMQDFEERGAALGHPPNLFFDAAYYLATNPTLPAAIASGDFRSAFDHYRLIGWRDRDPHWLFSITHYSRAYVDLTPDAIDDWGGFYGHFLRFGAPEGRIAHHFFDPKCYLATVPPDDLAAAKRDPFGHFLAALDMSVRSLSPEPSGSPYFDIDWYAATYPDAVQPVPGRQGQGALHHYLTAGAAQGRDPLCDFSETDYRAANADVEEAIGIGYFASGYQHFLSFGAIAARSPTNDIDLAWYAAQPSVAADLATGAFRHAFTHLLTVGIHAGLPLRPPVAPGFAPNETETRNQFVVQAQRALLGFGRHPLDFRHDGTPDVSVIVVLRNQFALTMQALASLRHTYQGAIELILVDNASHDGTREIGDLVHGARIIRSAENLGFLRACNLALQHVTAPAVLYLNNDVILHADAIRLGLARLSTDPTVGAVGGKVIRTHGLLQEAGCVLWRDGSANGWMRDATPDAPEANYVRDVDFCSGCFLLARTDLVRTLGGFDEAFAPAYYEEVDLCLRMQAEGFRVVYDPAISLTHFEYASARSTRASVALMVANRATLRARHPVALRNRPVDRRRMSAAASLASAGRRVLFIEDTVPMPRLGSGFGRAADVLTALVGAGFQATLFPMHSFGTARYHMTAALPDTAEVLWDRDQRTLEAFLDERRGFYDLIWVSRAHNLRHLMGIVNRCGHGLEGARLILDTEAVFSLREAERAKLDGLPFNIDAALAQEFDGAWMCDHVVAVNETEAAVLRGLALSSVGVIGFNVAPVPTPNPWGERQGMLHVGALTSDGAPNADGLRWFLDVVHPKLQDLVGKAAARLTVAGHVLNGVDLSWLKDNPAVDFLGPVTDLQPLYDSHRAFVAPTRFAAGVATKVLEAAAHGIPIACTDLLAEQLGWIGTTKILSAPCTDPAAFAANLARLLQDRKIWTRQRAAALAAIGTDFSPARFAQQIAEATAAAGVPTPASRPAAKMRA